MDNEISETHVLFHRKNVHMLFERMADTAKVKNQKYLSFPSSCQEVAHSLHILSARMM